MWAHVRRTNPKFCSVLAEFRSKIDKATTEEEKRIIEAYMEDYKSAVNLDPIRAKPNARFLLLCSILWMPTIRVY